MRRACLLLFLVGCAAKPRLDGSWDPYNQARLERLIAEHRSDGKRPYAVFDWDNTSIFLDVQEAVLAFQLLNLAFEMTPEEFSRAIRTNLPANERVDQLTADIVESYSALHSRELRHFWGSPHHTNFMAKLRYLYEFIGDTFDHSVSYPWVTYLLSGMSERQVRDLTRAAVEWQQKEPVGTVTWTSPESMPGKAGVVSVTWKNGLRLVPEMRELYRRLRDSGFDVWVCSASFVDVVKEISSLYGLSDDRVLAMELERRDGRIVPEFRKGYDQTQGKGKTLAIRRFLVSKYGYGPVFIAGGSEGDQNMMQDFEDTRLVLIVNRLRKPSTDIGRFSKLAVETYGTSDAKYLLQGRDENTGRFVPSQSTIRLGRTEGEKLPK